MGFVNLSLYDPRRVMESTASREQKIILLWLITQIDYRGIQGNPAEEALREVVGDQEVLNAFSQIVGMSAGHETDAPRKFSESGVSVFVRLFHEISEGVVL